MDPGIGGETDTEIGIERGSGAHKSELIPKSISAPAPDGPRAGLPDFTAMIMAEIAAAEGLQERARTTGSPLGAGELVLTARELSGISQRQLADRLQTSQPAIASIESGNRVPTIRTLMRVAEASGFELVIGLRSPGATTPRVLGAMAFSEDSLADYFPIKAPSVYEGPPDR